MLQLARCYESLLEKIEDKRRTNSTVAQDTTLFHRPRECLCMLKHIAGVHKVYLGEYTGARARDNGARI